MTAIAPIQGTGQMPVVTSPVPARERLFADAVETRPWRVRARMFLHQPRALSLIEITVGALVVFVAGIVCVGWMVI